MRVTHAITNKYKLLIFLNYYLQFIIWKSLSDLDFRIVIHSNFLSRMHGYELLLQVRYHVIVIWPPGGASCNFS